MGMGQKGTEKRKPEMTLNKWKSVNAEAAFLVTSLGVGDFQIACFVDETFEK